MSRLSIELSPEQHQQIKTLATLQGKSVKTFILEKLFSIPTEDAEQKAVSELKTLLSGRIAAAESGAITTKTFAQITNETIQKSRLN